MWWADLNSTLGSRGFYSGNFAAASLIIQRTGYRHQRYKEVGLARDRRLTRLQGSNQLIDVLPLLLARRNPSFGRPHDIQQSLLQLFFGGSQSIAVFVRDVGAPKLHNSSRAGWNAQEKGYGVRRQSALLPPRSHCQHSENEDQEQTGAPLKLLRS